MKHLRQYIRQILTENHIRQQAGWFLNIEDGFEEMPRREVPASEQLNKRRFFDLAR